MKHQPRYCILPDVLFYLTEPHQSSITLSIWTNYELRMGFLISVAINDNIWSSIQCLFPTLSPSTLNIFLLPIDTLLVKFHYVIIDGNMFLGSEFIWCTGKHCTSSTPTPTPIGQKISLVIDNARWHGMVKDISIRGPHILDPTLTTCSNAYSFLL